MGGIFISKVDKFKIGQTYLHYFNNSTIMHDRYWIIFKLLDAPINYINNDLFDIKIIYTNAPAYLKNINGCINQYSIVPVWLYNTKEINDLEIMAKVI